MLKATSGFYTEKYQDHIPCSFAYKLVLIINLASQLFFTGVKMQLIISLKWCLKSLGTVKKVMKKYFNKNVIMTENKEENFFDQMWYVICWICEKLIGDEKVRGHCHITGKYRCAAQRSCNVNLKLTKKYIYYFII